VTVTVTVTVTASVFGRAAASFLLDSRSMHKFVSLLIVTALTSPALAATKAGVTMPESEQVAGKQLTLNGMGVREATFLKVKVYVAGLYVEQPSSNGNQLVSSKQVKRMEMHFTRDVSHSDIRDAWNTAFKRDPATAAKLQGDIQDARWLDDRHEQRRHADVHVCAGPRHHG